MKILYICTHNRCRSILSEAITNYLAKGRLQAYSAGSQPAGEVHPLSLKYLAEKGLPIAGLRSQSWNDFARDLPDIVITVCDSAAAEACPVWFADTAKIHWGLPDPSKLAGSDTEIRDAFYEVMATIEQRVQKLLDVDLKGLSKTECESVLKSLSEA
ncbi:MAG: arsenate reductase ArsC [Cellvibrionaceae bacterium]|nr:arsenate reductase ArsC [Cellvibrionaceae bacterium]